jgi:hypothetical protein
MTGIRSPYPPFFGFIGAFPDGRFNPFLYSEFSITAFVHSLMRVRRRRHGWSLVKKKRKKQKKNQQEARLVCIVPRPNKLDKFTTREHS